MIAPRCRCNSGGGAGGLAGAFASGFAFGANASGSSFVRGTTVQTPDGTIAIEDLREGDMVVARDQDGGVTGVYPVTAIMQRQTASVLYLTLENANGETSE